MHESPAVQKEKEAELEYRMKADVAPRRIGSCNSRELYPVLVPCERVSWSPRYWTCSPTSFFLDGAAVKGPFVHSKFCVFIFPRVFSSASDEPIKLLKMLYFY